MGGSASSDFFQSALNGLGLRLLAHGLQSRAFFILGDGRGPSGGRRRAEYSSC